MTPRNPDINSPSIIILPTSVTINGAPVHKAGAIAEFHSMLREPSRIVPAGSAAPVGHRNNQTHFYDELGITLNEHHYTYQIQGITIILSVAEAIHPTTIPFRGHLDIGGIHIHAGDTECDFTETSIPFQPVLLGVWSAEVLSAPTDGHVIHVSIDTKGRKLPSGRRSQRREIISVSVGLEHDPWDITHRPT